MKNTILKFTFLLFAFILTIGCSVEKEDALEQELITANLFGVPTIETPTCADNNLDIVGYCISYINVEYKDGVTNKVKHRIRAPYCDNLVSVESCSSNPNVEIWTVREGCIEQPSVVPPVDPDLESTTYPSIGVCQ
ncbi:MAG: hypothetical protein ACI9Y7_000346 [Dokdonia sp.]|jgi:hypothetical protein